MGHFPFEWKHPRTGSTVDMRFSRGAPNYAHAGAEEFATSFSVEVLAMRSLSSWFRTEAQAQQTGDVYVTLLEVTIQVLVKLYI